MGRTLAFAVLLIIALAAPSIAAGLIFGWGSRSSFALKDIAFLSAVAAWGGLAGRFIFGPLLFPRRRRPALRAVDDGAGSVVSLADVRAARERREVGEHPTTPRGAA